METFRNILLHEPEPQPSAERAACTCQEQPVCFPVFHVVQQTSHLCSGSASLLSFPNSVISIYEYVDAHEIAMKVRLNFGMCVKIEIAKEREAGVLSSLRPKRNRPPN